jgi:hypothetical protein
VAATTDQDHFDLVTSVDGTSARYVTIVIGAEGVQHSLVLYRADRCPATTRSAPWRQRPRAFYQHKRHPGAACWAFPCCTGPAGGTNPRWLFPQVKTLIDYCKWPSLLQISPPDDEPKHL